MPGRSRVVKGPTIWKKRECLFYGRGENEWEGRDAHASAETFWWGGPPRQRWGQAVVPETKGRSWSQGWASPDISALKRSAGWLEEALWLSYAIVLWGFFLHSFCYSQLLESGWGGVLGSACRTVSLGLRSPDWFQHYRRRERACCWEMDPLPSSSFFIAIWYVGLFHSLGFLSKASASAGGR